MRKLVTRKLAFTCAHFFLAILLVSGISANSVWAKTSDGSTAAQVDICAGLNGEAYELCNRYCNAMECGTENPKASDGACVRVLANFRRHSTLTDPPCVDPCAYLELKASCPCDFNLVPKTTECWQCCPSCVDQPYFQPCSQSGCLQGDTTDCAIEQPVNVDGMNFSAAMGINFNNSRNTYECSISMNQPSCEVIESNNINLSPGQLTTCKCRLEHYADDLYNTADITGGSPPYSCESTQ
jgi:hypothetical protein